MKLREAEGKKIRITINDGRTFEGIGDLYTSALDNPEEKASISIGNLEFFEDEIAKIEEIKLKDVKKK